MRDEILEDLKKRIATLGYVPVFCDVLVGSDKASEQYVDMKYKTAKKLGIEVLPARFPESISTEDLLTEIRKLNAVDRMCGLIVQLPLPPHIDKEKILDAIDPGLDVDCTGEKCSKMFYGGDPKFIFPTALAVMRIIDSLGIDLSSKKIVIIGKGELVGRPVKQMFLKREIDVFVVDRDTKNVGEILMDADLVISAAGRGGLITGDMLKKGSIVIDAGTSESYGSIVGDADFESVSRIASIVSPVPGGVGPVTVAMLFSNVLKAAEMKYN